MYKSKKIPFALRSNEIIKDAKCLKTPNCNFFETDKLSYFKVTSKDTQSIVKTLEIWVFYFVWVKGNFGGGQKSYDNFGNVIENILSFSLLWILEKYDSKYKSRVKRSLWKNVTPNIWTSIYVDYGWNGVTEHITKGKILIFYDTGYNFW